MPGLITSLFIQSSNDVVSFMINIMENNNQSIPERPIFHPRNQNKLVSFGNLVEVSINKKSKKFVFGCSEVPLAGTLCCQNSMAKAIWQQPVGYKGTFIENGKKKTLVIKNIGLPRQAEEFLVSQNPPKMGVV